jgi:hypothetical protein
MATKYKWIILDFMGELVGTDNDGIAEFYEEQGCTVCQSSDIEEADAPDEE